MMLLPVEGLQRRLLLTEAFSGHLELCRLKLLRQVFVQITDEQVETQT